MLRVTNKRVRSGQIVIQLQRSLALCNTPEYTVCYNLYCTKGRMGEGMIGAHRERFRQSSLGRRKVYVSITAHDRITDDRIDNRHSDKSFDILGIERQSTQKNPRVSIMDWGVCALFKQARP